ncbi:SDR family NAD(P)-dependent oxidoreductase [Rhodococcoides kroppenstedtii]|uniref:SDR family NAD(P)-dependent oxidoreductase n=1 Tax=Rhodococcoides kroppenstedtii TaxID=293050 RepID=UPI001427ACB1|nr:putative oxidoreductase [Rhodococcus kroppenstedtii]
MTGALTGRRLLITGASSGIGAAAARLAASAGARVALIARREAELTALADELGGLAVPADVTDAAALTAAVDRAAAELDGLDGVIASAGVARPINVATDDPADMANLVQVNVIGLLHTLRATVPHLIASGAGDVVVLSSLSGRRVPRDTMGVYSGTKFAAHAIAEGLRLELADEPVRVTTVAPGYVATPIADAATGSDAERFRADVAAHGMSPVTIARLIVTALTTPREAELVELAVRPTGE